MKNLLLSFLAVFSLLVVSRSNAQPLPPCYHSRAGVDSFIFALRDFDTRGIIRIDSIGHSRGDMLGVQYPIYAVKISDNVNTFENEPTSLIICHIHAEEVIGMEMALDYMWRLVHNYQQYRDLINNTQMYFIPTMNPDGLEVLSSGVDNTWRKNGYRPPEMGDRTCNISPGVGEDSCGVDLNRNFELNWIYGDTLWKRENTEPFDYYRGPGPFSEPETQAVRNLALEIKPTVSLVSHSSRSGNISEQCVIPWAWGGPDPHPSKYPPDYPQIRNLVEPYRALLHKIQNGSAYDSVYSSGHNGSLQDWFYWRLGTLQILTEFGPPINIQPDCDLLADLIPEFQIALDWLNKRMINLGTNQAAPLAIYTRDASTQQPISAEWRIAESWTPFLAPRYTHPSFGRATILPPQGNITIIARKEGYFADTASTSIQPGGFTQSLTLDLAPRAIHQLNFNIRDGANQSLASSVQLEYEYPKTYSAPAGTLTLNQQEDLYRVGIYPQNGNYLALWYNLWHDRDTTFNVVLPAGNEIFSENFESGLANWTTGGTGSNWQLDVDTTVFQFGNNLTTNLTGYRIIYGNNLDATLTYNNPINLGGGNSAHLEFYRRGRLDMPGDSLLIEVSADGGSNWSQVGGYSDRDIEWTKTYASLSPYTGNSIRLRLHFKTDFALGELGMHLDNFRILSGTDLSAPEKPAPQIYDYRITGAYPNPFNPSTSITYTVPHAGAVTIAIYNLLGQEVQKFDLQPQAAGQYTLIWNAENHSGNAVPSGLYFAKLQGENTASTHKLLLLR